MNKDLAFYSNFALADSTVTTLEEYQQLLAELGFTAEDIGETGSGHSCFGVTYSKTFNEGLDNEWWVSLNDTVTFEGEIIVELRVTTFEGEDDIKGTTAASKEVTFNLAATSEVLKFAKFYDYNKHLVEFKGLLYFTLIGGGMQGEFITIEDGTQILVSELATYDVTPV